MWKFPGQDWQNSEATLDKIPVGRHQISFKPAPGWNIPSLSVVVKKDELTEATGEYKLPEYGSLKVVFMPEAILEAGYHWRPQGVTEWNESGQAVEILVGSYQIEIQPKEQSKVKWTAPRLTAKITKNNLTELKATFSEIKEGSVIITLKPENDERLKGGQWKIDAGPWQNSGVQIDGIKEGSRKISFKPVSGWTAPKSITIEVTKDQTAQAEAEYLIQKPPAPKFTVTTTISIGPDDGMAWIKKSASAKEIGYRVGKMVDKYKLLKVSNGEITLGKDGYEWDIKIVKLKTPAKPSVSPAKSTTKPKYIPSSSRSKMPRSLPTKNVSPSRK